MHSASWTWTLATSNLIQFIVFLLFFANEDFKVAINPANYIPQTWKFKILHNFSQTGFRTANIKLPQIEYGLTQSGVSYPIILGEYLTMH